MITRLYFTYTDSVSWADPESENSFPMWDALSYREKQVVSLAVLDNTNRQIASRLGISPETVKTHLTHSLTKLGLHAKISLIRAFDGFDLSSWRSVNLPEEVSITRKKRVFDPIKAEM